MGFRYRDFKVVCELEGDNMKGAPLHPPTYPSSSILAPLSCQLCVLCHDFGRCCSGSQKSIPV